MQELAAAVGPWPVVVVCVLVAVVVPISAARQLTPELLRETYVPHRPGRVVAMAIVVLGMLSVVAAIIALLALDHPFFWAVEATVLSGVVVVAMHLMRYRAAARAYDGRGPSDEDDAGEPAGA